MGGIVGKVTDAIGLTDHEGEEEARRQAALSGERAYAMSKEQIALMKEQLEFQKEQYADWKDIYGDIQDNLGEYYKNLDADDITVMGLQNQQREYQEAVKLINADAAQRGISDSGLEYATESAMTMQNAMERARIRTEAPQKVAERKMQFLGLGLGQGTQMLGLINQAGANANSAFSTGVNSQTYMNSNYLNQQTELTKMNTEATAQFYSDIAGFAGSKGYI